MIESAGSSRAQARTVATAAIQSASTATGADFQFLLKTAQRESGFNASAQASTSSARGLFQFTSGTWLSMVDRYGAQHGLDVTGASREQILALRDDPALSARMAGELARENAAAMARDIGRQPTSGELYAAHFLGPAEASRLIQAARTGGEVSASAVFPAAAAANTPVFEANGRERTVAELYANLTGHSVGAADRGEIATAGTGAMNAAPADHADAVLAARLGVAQLASTLMTALFDLQSEPGKGRSDV